MTRVLILHAYSSENRGDGLLVDETISIVQSAAGSGSDVTMISGHPGSFAYLKDVRHIPSTPKTLSGIGALLAVLLRIRSFDLVVGVGGGYLRGKRPLELFKTVLAHGPQLVAASFAGQNSVYLPQSIGPFGSVARILVGSRLKRIRAVWVRDDRSLDELGRYGVLRGRDLAILGMKRAQLPFDGDLDPILTVRDVNGQLPSLIPLLREKMGRITTFVQSEVGSNNDVSATRALRADSQVSADRVMGASRSRVVVAVRLHAALMALAAGHYVIHLSYERKGFGAFQDLGLSDFVFNVSSFDVDKVARLVAALRESEDLRRSYDAKIKASVCASSEVLSDILLSIRQACGQAAPTSSVHPAP